MEVTTTSTIDPTNMYNYMNNFTLNPYILLIIIIISLLYLMIFYSLGNKDIDYNNENNNLSSKILVFFVIIIFIILIIINAFQYFFNISITTYLSNLFSYEPEIDIVINQQQQYHPNQEQPIPEITTKKQVFNIPGNYYSYDDAKAICKAYGSELATYNQIENAYNNGAEWCNYGWSANQLALFPTQQKTYDNLQKIEGHENDCGRPGINGGYIANPNIKYGINCYGYKPDMNAEEQQLMAISTPYPQTQKDILFQKKVNYWKSQLDNILVSPFNYNTWSN